MKVEQFTDVFSLRDEIGTCPFIEVHLKLKDETPFFVRPYPMREEQKKVIQKEMDRLKHLGIIHKGLTSYSSLVVLVKRKNPNLYRVCSDFCILNEKLVKINHAFLLVRDCIGQLGRKKCHYLSTIDLRDTFHMLGLALSSQKYCSITLYYGSPTYHYLLMGMGMSVSPQIWQQFVDLVFQDDLIKHKQNFDVIMDDTFIHSTAEEHMDDLIQGFEKMFVDLVFQDDLIKHKQNFDVIMDDTFIHSTAKEHMDDLIQGFEKMWFEIITSQMLIFQVKDSLYGTRISDTERQSMLHPIKRQM